MSSPPPPNAPIRGESAAVGFGVGQIAVVADPEPHGVPATDIERDPDTVFDLARDELAGEAATASGETAEILTAQLALLDDPTLRSGIEEARRDGANTTEAIDRATTTLRARLAASDLERIRQRAGDVDDLATRLIAAATGRRRPPVMPDGAGPFILVAHDLLPSQTAQLDPQRVTGIVLEGGGPTAHAAIIARALAIPLVTGADRARELLAACEAAAVDGTHGEVWPDPDESKLSALRDSQPAPTASDGPAVRRVEFDGGGVDLAVNVGAVAEAERAAAAGGRAIGLLRSELLAFAGLRTRAALTDALRRIGSAIDGPVVFRLLDVGGDKPLEGVTLDDEPNPMLGARGVRLLDRAPHDFDEQLAAVAAVQGDVDVRVSIPMVVDASEVVAVRERWARLTDTPPPPIGIMVETPAAVVLAEALAQVSDFFSIGTNDLAQYLLAADRGNPAVADLVHATHPAVLRAVREVVRAAATGGIPVAVCGQAAADPVAQRLLVGLGVDELSVPVDAFQTTAAAFDGADLEALRAEANRACESSTAATRTEADTSAAAGEPPGTIPSEAVTSDDNWFEVTNVDGLHVRPASQLAEVATEHGVQITVRTPSGEGDAGSVFSILALGIDAGDRVQIELDGDNAAQAWPRVRAILRGDDP